MILQQDYTENINFILFFHLLYTFYAADTQRDFRIELL